jgi:DNA-binding transcriptional LysR family regulator
MTPSLPRDFDWSLMRSFLAALDQASLLGAARVLHLSQPTVGRHIAELESQLGVLLFERTGRGLLPTATALQLAEAARSMEAGALQLARTLSGAQTQTRGSVRITASVPVAVQLLPPLLASMRQALPDIQVDLVSSNQVSNLLRREADIAVRMVRPTQCSLIAKKSEMWHWVPTPTAATWRVAALCAKPPTCYSTSSSAATPTPASCKAFRPWVIR